MREIMDRLCASLTEIDKTIRQQRRALATVAAMSNMSDLESARDHIRQAQMALTHFESDALPPMAPQPDIIQPGKL